MREATNQAGVFITQVGQSVGKCADWQYVFNSNWPSLAVAFEKTISVPYSNESTPGSIVIPHNLGFYPFTQAWMTVNGKLIYTFYGAPTNIGAGASYSAQTFSVSKNNIYPAWFFEADTNSSPQVDPFGNRTDFSQTAVIHVKCYNLDLTKVANYTAPTPATVKTPYDSSVGIKIVKQGRNIRSTDLRDFILHSRAQSPAVLSVQTQAQGIPDPNVAGNTLIAYTNPAGVVNWFFGWTYTNFGSIGSPDFRYVPIPVMPSNFAAGGSVSGTNTFQITVPNANGGGGTLVVLRDPLFAPNNVSVLW